MLRTSHVAELLRYSVLNLLEQAGFNCGPEVTGSDLPTANPECDFNTHPCLLNDFALRGCLHQVRERHLQTFDSERTCVLQNNTLRLFPKCVLLGCIKELVSRVCKAVQEENFS